MKRLLITIPLLLCSIVMVASETDTKLIVWKCDGTKEVISLEEKPVTTFDKDGITINTSRISITYPKNEIAKYTYEGILNGIDFVNATNNGVQFYQEGNTIIITNYSKDSNVYVYTAGGTTKDTVVSKYGSTVRVTFDNYPEGVYILKINNATYKFLKR